MDDVFDLFPESIRTYTFFELNTGGIFGNTVKRSFDFDGILKERKGMTVNNNMETVESSTTLHIKPDQAFISTLAQYAELGFVGCGIEATHNGVTKTYRITGYPDGRNFDTGETEFYRLTVKEEKLAEFDNASSS